MNHRHRRPISSGFSLIELMLVIGIIAVFSAMAAPRYAGSLYRYRADAAAKRISADITMAQSRARATASSRSLIFSGNTYRIPSERDLAVAANTYAVDLTTAPYFVSISTVNFGGAATLTFNGYGVPSAAGSITIRSGPTTRAISVDADSGTVKVQ